MAPLLERLSDSAWLLVEAGVPGPREHEIESIFAIGNGYVGSRASLAEDGPLSDPGTFIAGVFTSDLEPGLGPALAELPDWSHLEILVGGRRLSFDAGRVLEHRRVLDMRQGVLWRQWQQQDASGRITRVTFLRFASLADRHLLVQSVTIAAENHAGTVGIAARSPSSDGTVAFATAFHPQPRPAAELEAAGGETRWSWDLSLGESVRLDRIVAVYTSRDTTVASDAAAHLIETVREEDAASVVEAHLERWRARWQDADVKVAGDESAQRALRFAAYHLLSAADPDDERASIGARGLTGAAYRGHVFWDAEIYMLPFYLFADPASARALLMYRYHTLDGARRKARAHGFRGALYAWESADTGDETAPPAALTPDGQVVPILTGEQEQHISADVAYAVSQYWQATGDDEFMIAAGAEILVETARFWASRVRIEPDGSAHIPRVIGPDEYHDAVDDNAYTNVMARRNLERAADAVAHLEREAVGSWRQLSARLELDRSEPDEWRKLAASLVTGFDPATGLFEQFAGYFSLEPIDVETIRKCGVPVDVCIGRERTRRSQAIKQADVVALSALLWDEWPRSVHEANFRYYAPRTGHGSSLSPAFYALVAARLGHGDSALDLFREAAAIDLANNMGNAAGGVHLGALGGLWQAAVFGMAGVRIRDQGIALDPHLPPGWSAMQCRARWRRNVLRIHISAEPLAVDIEVLGTGTLMLSILDGPACHAHADRRYHIGREQATWSEWQEVRG